MPELNHNFMKGRMNKDLDERLVANGEYRDALNIEVSTSEGANVGAVQTTMGNTLVSGLNLSGFTCVGSITDEKNDAIYWFATSANKDLILKYDYDLASQSYLTTIVFVDTTKKVLNFDSGRLITGINILDDMLFWTDNYSEPKKINIPRSIEGTININTHTYFVVKDESSNILHSATFNPMPVEEEHITVIKKAPLTAPNLTMSDSEDNRGNIHTSINTSFTDNVGQNLLASTTSQSTLVTFNSSTFGTPDYRVGDHVICSNNNNGVANFTNYEVRLVLESIDTVTSNGTLDYVFSISTITNVQLPSITETWSFNLIKGESLFEFKFPRFAFRYKFQDGEYSPFSPWSEVAFIPGIFDYNPKKGYNLGMVNQLRFLKVQDFVPEDSIRPIGVVAIDVLYKESNSPNVYTLKTITTSDSEWNVDGTNPNSSNVLTRGSIEVTSELIYAVVPSNQTLRHWDNVPKKALAQEITSNRLVYGNYTHQYDILDPNIDLQTVLQSTSIAANGSDPQKSLKSLRTYQLGIVYRDVYGRETPVLASKQDGVGIDVGKEFANKKNQLKVNIGNNAPGWADSFKFFIKETSNEYYNLAMDRWYNAEDGNVWISFPSSERNKVDEDTYLILKKQHDNDVFVKSEAKYKVIAIDNEAPEFITITKKAYGSMNNNGAKTLFGDQGAGGYPHEDSSFVYIHKETLDNTPLFNATTDENVTRYIRFRTTSRKSQWYEIAAIRAIELQNTGTADAYHIKLATSFKEDMAFTTNDNGVLGTGLWADRISGLKVEMAKDEKEVKPEHRGRFFVKIYKDGVLQKNIMTPKSQEQELVTVFSEPIYYIDDPDNWQINGSWESQVPSGSNANSFWDAIWASVSFWSWGSVLNGENGAKNWWNNFGSHWFIDNKRSRTNGWGNGDNNGAGLHGGPGGLTNPYNSYPKTIQLAFSGIYLPGVAPDAGLLAEPKNHEHGDHHNINVGTNSNLDEKTWVDYITTPGTIFKWAKDPDGVYYVVEDATLYKSGSTINDTSGKGYIKDEICNFDAQNLPGTGNFEMSANKRIRYEVTVGQWTIGSLLPGESGYVPGLGIGDTSSLACVSGYDPRYTTTSFSTGATVSGANHYDNAHAIEILEYEIDEEDDFSSTNPAIWETEPKEDIGLDIYYEASSSNPITLDYKTNEIYVPVTSKLTLPALPQITVSGSLTDRVWTTNVTSAVIPDLQVTAFNDTTITINGRPTDQNGGYLIAGDKITFLKPNGGRITGTVATNITASNNVGSSYQTIPLLSNLHDETYYLDWYNCFAFGNGVESNRIRDDYNQVTIDKSPKASITLATPYEEETKTNGLIYSGIYNSTSGVNNLNQFIMAEKITKDLSPRFGSIQKLHSRDSDIVAFCEDKVVRLLANKDAVYNADGNVQLIATNRVLGQTVPFAGEHGISKNPESFATQAYQCYFSDKSRGVVMRLSRDGLTPVSEHGMKDWFNDNLKHAKTIIGSYDDKKSLYNITLNSSGTTRGETTASVDPFDFATTNALGDWAFNTSPGNGKWTSYDVNGGLVNAAVDTVTTIVMGAADFTSSSRASEFANIINALNTHGAGNVLLHYTSYSPGGYNSGEVVTYAITSITIDENGNYVITIVHESGTHIHGVDFHFWWSLKSVDSETPSSKVTTDYTLSFAEKTNGWVSFKSWIQEGGLSINGKFYTFNGGDIYEHESNSTRNNFYGTQYTSTIDVLLNESPNVVKSFQTLKYSGSQARITQNKLTGSNADGNNQFDQEYYNNFGKNGWFISYAETDLQTGKILEFKPKEGKWFTRMQGLSTYFNSATDTNVDEKEFSVQGIGYAGNVICPDCGSGTVAGVACDDKVIMTDSSGDNLVFGVGTNAPTVNHIMEWFNQDATHRAYIFEDYTFEYVNYSAIPPDSCLTDNPDNTWKYVLDVTVTIPVNSNGHSAGTHTFFNYADLISFITPITGQTNPSHEDLTTEIYNIYGYYATVAVGIPACICGDDGTGTVTDYTLTVKDNPLDH